MISEQFDATAMFVSQKKHSNVSNIAETLLPTAGTPLAQISPALPEPIANASVERLMTHSVSNTTTTTTTSSSSSSSSSSQEYSSATLEPLQVELASDFESTPSSSPSRYQQQQNPGQPYSPLCSTPSSIRKLKYENGLAVASTTIRAPIERAVAFEMVINEYKNKYESKESSPMCTLHPEENLDVNNIMCGSAVIEECDFRELAAEAEAEAEAVKLQAEIKAEEEKEAFDLQAKLKLHKEGMAAKLEAKLKAEEVEAELEAKLNAERLAAELDSKLWSRKEDVSAELESKLKAEKEEEKVELEDQLKVQNSGAAHDAAVKLDANTFSPPEDGDTKANKRLTFTPTSSISITEKGSVSKSARINLISQNQHVLWKLYRLYVSQSTINVNTSAARVRSSKAASASPSPSPSPSPRFVRSVAPTENLPSKPLLSTWSGSARSISPMSPPPISLSSSSSSSNLPSTSSQSFSFFTNPLRARPASPSKAQFTMQREADMNVNALDLNALYDFMKDFGICPLFCNKYRLNKLAKNIFDPLTYPIIDEKQKELAKTSAAKSSLKTTNVPKERLNSLQFGAEGGPCFDEVIFYSTADSDTSPNIEISTNTSTNTSTHTHIHIHTYKYLHRGNRHGHVLRYRCSVKMRSLRVIPVHLLLQHQVHECFVPVWSQPVG